ncbi:c-type cytochrome [Nitrospirillum viridazoti]|uniref:Cytochrome c n=1 Tax=Nitrospirillum amazonense TaxID=28077 RepID=A0A560HRJ9_9PROT|nr:cytochrome c [Nitrospirillum amazonense]TWB47660.1 cytochrome c [Nitrospirillum amazonense]
MRASLTVLCCLIATACAARQDNPEAVRRGKELAITWCSECHRVGPDQPTGARPGHIMPPPMNAPSFMSVAARPDVDRRHLKGFASDLHLPMPIYHLTSEQQDDLITYILSLKER